jgi:hypothetical protein
VLTRSRYDLAGALGRVGDDQQGAGGEPIELYAALIDRLARRLEEVASLTA